MNEYLRKIPKEVMEYIKKDLMENYQPNERIKIGRIRTGSKKFGNLVFGYVIVPFEMPIHISLYLLGIEIIRERWDRIYFWLTDTEETVKKIHSFTIYNLERKEIGPRLGKEKKESG